MSNGMMKASPPLKSRCSVRSMFLESMTYFLRTLKTFWKKPGFFSSFGVAL